MGWMDPAPMPWINRNTIIDGIDQARPARIEPTVKTAMPNSITGFRPKTSDSLPKTTVVAVWVSRKPAKTQL